ncbi:hypothetical protein LIOPPNJA_05930 [Robbsia andropogonis]|uniref:hypothetical protein n=2 Tax=Robbsia andropogonis TaxID=28092 RepID=UPI00209F0251|nr:hypothetical protein [Robbsia andropogonis]MCP1117959.1 hypothetical protein [Robbsia andropogonis]MCP1127424.1 hypothetical protein [Robbsia andropogonis]
MMKNDLAASAAATLSRGAARGVWHAFGKSLAVVALAVVGLTAFHAEAAPVNIGINVGTPGYVGGPPPPPPPPPRRYRRRHWHRPPPPPPPPPHRYRHRGPPRPGWNR